MKRCKTLWRFRKRSRFSFFLMFPSKLEKYVLMILRVCVCVRAPPLRVCIRLELENRLLELEQLRALQETTGNSKSTEFEDRLRAACLGEEAARKELQSIKYSHLR